MVNRKVGCGGCDVKDPVITPCNHQGWHGHRASSRKLIASPLERTKPADMIPEFQGPKLDLQGFNPELQRHNL